MQIINTFLCVTGTVLAYALVRSLYKRYKHPLINIVAGSAAIVIAVLVMMLAAGSISDFIDKPLP